MPARNPSLLSPAPASPGLCRPWNPHISRSQLPPPLCGVRFRAFPRKRTQPLGRQNPRTEHRQGRAPTGRSETRSGTVGSPGRPGRRRQGVPAAPGTTASWADQSAETGPGGRGNTKTAARPNPGERCGPTLSRELPAGWRAQPSREAQDRSPPIRRRWSGAGRPRPGGRQPALRERIGACSLRRPQADRQRP